MTEPIRLSKRVMQLMACSRREAELYIEGGWVTVAGTVVEQPQARVSDEPVAVSPEARPLTVRPVTLLLHKPAGAEAGLGPLPTGAGGPDLTDLRPAQEWLRAPHWDGDPAAGLTPLQRHFKDQVLMTPLAPRASGLVVFTQDPHIARKLHEDAHLLEREVLVDVAGTALPGALERLNRPDPGLQLDGHPLGPCKVSWQSETRLRFALKGERAGQIAFLCETLGLQVLAMRRLRIGRVAMGRLAPGQWRYLLPHERF